MKRLYKIADNLLILPLVAMVISVLSATIFLWTSHNMRTIIIITSATCNAIIMIVLFQKIRKRFQLILYAIQALDKRTLDDKQFANEGGLTGRVIKKLRSIGNKIAEATELIVKIGEGKEIGELKHLQEKDSIGVALTEMQDKITSYNDQERKRNWVVEGLAKFSEILRQNYDNETDMGFAVISNLVRYVDGNQGGFFIVNKDEEGNPHLELMASYAYDGRKYQEKIIYPGQGLLGQSMRDKETVYMTKVPDQYVSITSGLGEATPRNLIIIPLLLNEEYCGAIELASFEILADYQIEFLEKVAENIAAYVLSLKTNANTQELLQQSQTLTEELKSREEEMKQNLRELSATQEEMQRKQTELDGVFHAIDSAMGMVEFGMDGKVLAVNESLLDIYGFKQKEVVGKYQDVLLGDQKNYDQVLGDLQENKSNSGDFKVRSKSGEDLWINASFTAVKNKDDQVDKVLMLAQNITAKKNAEKEFEQLSLVADNTDNSVIITNSQGKIEFVNNGFTKLTGYELEESIGKKPGGFLQGADTDQETVTRISKQLKEGKSIYEEILNYRKTGESYWISLVINPIFDEDGKVEKFISIQADITETKIKSLDYAYKLEAISRSNAVIEFNIDGNVEDVNQNFLDIFGYKKEELLHQHHSMMVDEQTKSSSGYAQHWERLRNGDHLQGEFKRIHKNGKEIWLRGIYNPVFDINGELSKIVKFAVDITKEKKLQLETQQQDALLKNQLDTINKTLASVEYDIDGKITDANEIFLGVTGYDKKELISKPYTRLIPASELDKPQTQIMWQNLKEGQFFTGEFKLVDKSGKELWLLGTYNPILDQQGKPIKIVMFAQFTTQEKEKQMDLKGTTNALKMSLPMMELNTDGTFKNANDLFYKRFGYKRLELRNTKFDLFLNGSAKKTNLSDIFKRLQEGQFVEEHLKLINKNGEPGQFKTTFCPIKNLENKLSKIVVILIGES